MWSLNSPCLIFYSRKVPGIRKVMRMLKLSISFWYLGLCCDVLKCLIHAVCNNMLEDLQKSPSPCCCADKCCFHLKAWLNLAMLLIYLINI